MVISAADLAGIRTSVNALLPETCVNNRTLLTIPCLVDIQTKTVRVPGLPFFMAPTRWDFTMPYTADVRVGDQLDRGGGGVFEVLQLDASDSNVVQTVAYTVKLNTNAIVSNTTVTFSRRIAGVLTSSPATPVYIQPLRDEERLVLNLVNFSWRVYFPSDTAISGITIAAGDSIVWSGLKSGSSLKSGSAILNRPAVYVGPVNFTVSLFSESLT